MTNTLRHASDGYDAQAETTQRLAAAVHDGVDRVAERARGLEQTLRERGAVLGKQARKHEERARVAVAEQLQKASGYLREQSLAGAGIALAAAVGIVIGGWLLLRR